MYRKYKEQKDREYETIIRRQVNESKLVAEHEGISIPKTLEDYVAPSRAGANGKKTIYSVSSHDDDDLGIDVSNARHVSIIVRMESFSRTTMIIWLIWTMKKALIMTATN